MKSPAWYSYWAEVLRGGDANAAYVKQVLTQRRALSAEAKRLSDAQELEAMRGKAKLLGQVDALTAKGRITAENPDIPKRAVILQGYFREQETSYWCGPATMKSIADADGVVKSQAQWAEILGTTREQGTALGMITWAINTYTNWDLPDRGGTYAPIYIGDKPKSWLINFYSLQIGLGGAPVVQHVLLNHGYFLYLKGDYGGHYQTGRGYDLDLQKIYFFEPFDEGDWTQYKENHTAGPQQIFYGILYDAIKARAGYIGG